MKRLITRQVIAARIDDLISEKMSIRDFGEEMLDYYAFNERYQFEPGYEQAINDILSEFQEMHDFGKKNAGYDVSKFIPTEARLKEIRQILLSEQ